jgi:hypothetical protein
LIKTEAGQQVFKARSAQLAGKLRSAFLLFDGWRTVDEVLQATQGLGLGVADIDTLVQAGLLAEAPDSPPAAAPAASPSARSAQERYRDAYPVAVALTGKLGLSGFRLNLSVEAATSFDQLAAVAPRIRDAVGLQAYVPLEQALFA